MRFQRNISLARRHVEFTGVELANGAELAAPVEKAAMDLARVVTAPMEKVVRAMEKAAATGGAAEMEGKVGGRGGLDA